MSQNSLKLSHFRDLSILSWKCKCIFSKNGLSSRKATAKSEAKVHKLVISKLYLRKGHLENGLKAFNSQTMIRLYSRRIIFKKENLKVLTIVLFSSCMKYL